jgi:hypothetical protein
MGEGGHLLFNFKNETFDYENINSYERRGAPEVTVPWTTTFSVLPSRQRCFYGTYIMPFPLNVVTLT